MTKTSKDILGFQTADALEYERIRPGYSAQVVPSLRLGVGDRVLELGAGTGKFTADLLAAGLLVTAVEPDSSMCGVLSQYPDVRVVPTRTENLPFDDGEFDLVVAAQALHWFSNEAAAAQIWRVLRAKGRLVVVVNRGAHGSGWMGRVGPLVPKPSGEHIPGDKHLECFFDKFEMASRRVFPHEHVIARVDVPKLFTNNTLPALTFDERRRVGRKILRQLDSDPEVMGLSHLPVHLVTEVTVLRRIDA